ncbi:hypothetical protein KY290_003571 [Solanum tuberosum]|uniref:Pectin acetylesterase n=1 Tax=Solanum tuberosum TaxID=4113 RepID=A0ABQ7WVA3_SOLTU|nr:hypothetical protein KY289_003912 [Solanum tuberosum]KAH0783973.1 hypothetical protein KY290_003571 [Solanum tuberosum]
MVTSFLLFFVCLLIFVRTESLLVNITILETAVAKGAVCLDGTPPAYHLDRGSGPGVNNWVISVEGGGWCQNVTLCLTRKNTRLGSSAKMDHQLPFSGMMSNDPNFNPEFYNWNRVSVRYCDGGSFTGDVEAIDPGTGLHYRGARIFKAIMEELLAQGMNTSQNGSAKNLPPSCTSKLKPGLCFFPENVAQQIKTPLFIINAAYDHWQVRNILVAPGTDPKGAWTSCKANIKNCTPYQLTVLQGFREDFLKALEGLGRSSTRGYYINSCFSHCQSQQQAYWFGLNSPRLFNKTIAEAVRDWFLETDQYRHIDCPYPCDKTCVDATDIITSQHI